MQRTELGPRRTNLLEAWKRHATSKPSSEIHDFEGPRRYETAANCLEAFIASPSEDTFEALWQPDIIQDSVIGGPGMVLNNWPDTLEDLADLFEEMREADEYDEAWERHFISTSALWELYGLLDPANRPILSSRVLDGLNSFGFQPPSSYSDRTGYESFWNTYESLVGHATGGTGHEVPLHYEIEQFLSAVGTEERDTLLQALPIERDYPKFVGWQAEGDAGKIVFGNIDSLLDTYTNSRAGGAFENTETGLWGDGYWESWKWTHAEHVESRVKAEFDLKDLDADELEAFLNRFNNAPDVELSNSVPSYMLGGRSGGILWSNFTEHSLDNGDEAAEVLSLLFDENQPLSDRLARFIEFYSPLESSGGPILGLATMFLMFTYPDEYIMYKWGKFNAFFDEYSDYEVSTGFDSEQYWVINEACRRLVRELDARFEEVPDFDDSVSMLDVHTLIWVTVGIENL